MASAETLQTQVKQTYDDAVDQSDFTKPDGPTVVAPPPRGDFTPRAILEARATSERIRRYAAE